MIFLHAFVFGVTLALAVGPIALLIIRYAAANGLRAGLASAGGAALADLTYATIALSPFPDSTYRAGAYHSGSHAHWCRTVAPMDGDWATGANHRSAERTTSGATRSLTAPRDVCIDCGKSVNRDCVLGLHRPAPHECVNDDTDTGCAGPVHRKFDYSDRARDRRHVLGAYPRRGTRCTDVECDQWTRDRVIWRLGIITLRQEYS
jgi:hypothetical protein